VWEKRGDLAWERKEEARFKAGYKREKAGWSDRRRISAPDYGRAGSLRNERKGGGRSELRGETIGEGNEERQRMQPKKGERQH